MNDKMLMENWRKFLAESYSTGSPEEEEMGRMIRQFAKDRDFEAAMKSFTDSFDPESAQFAEPADIHRECKGTVGEFRQYLKDLAAADKKGAGIAKGSSALNPLRIFGLESAVEGIDAAGDLADVADLGEFTLEMSGHDDLVGAAFSAAADDAKTDYSREDRRMVPMLEFVTIDDKYKNLLRESVIQEFLTDYRRGKWLPGNDDAYMPDIDELLEDWIGEKYKGVKLDGVSSAREDYKGWCKKEAPTGVKMTLRHWQRIWGNKLDKLKDAAAKGSGPAKALYAKFQPIFARLQAKLTAKTEAEALAEGDINDFWRNFLLTEIKK